MNIFDLIIFLFISLFIYHGFINGPKRQLSRVIALLAGLTLGGILGGFVGNLLVKYNIFSKGIMTVVLSVAFFVLVYFFISAFGGSKEEYADELKMGARIGGGLLAGVKGFLVMAVGILILRATPADSFLNDNMSTLKPLPVTMDSLSLADSTAPKPVATPFDSLGNERKSKFLYLAYNLTGFMKPALENLKYTLNGPEAAVVDTAAVKAEDKKNDEKNKKTLDIK